MEISGKKMVQNKTVVKLVFFSAFLVVRAKEEVREFRGGAKFLFSPFVP